MNNIDLSIPSRQSPKGILVILVMSIKKVFKQAWPALIAIVFTGKDIFNSPWSALLFIGIPVVLLITHSILYYLNFYFFIKDDEFVIKSGYLNKKTLSIPQERIQNINTKQNLLQQLLGVSSLELDTAGTASHELKIHALEHNHVKELYDYLSLQKEKSAPISTDQSESTTFIKEKTQNNTILKLSIPDLFRIGISRNHLKAGLVILAFGWQFFDQVTESLDIKQDQYYTDFQNYLLGSDLLIISSMLIFFLLISIIYSLVDTTLKYFDLRLIKTDHTYRLINGLFNRKDVLIPFNKIQELEWNTNPLMRLLGLFQVKIAQASSAEVNIKHQQIIPGCRNNHIESLKKDLFGSNQPDQEKRFHTDNYYIRRLWLFWGWVPLAVSPVILLFNPWLWLIPPIWLGITLVMAYIHVQKRFLQINTEQIKTSSGTFGQKWTQIELFKLQNIQYNQSIFQKRKKLASLTIFTASGSISIPFIKDDLAKELYGYLLYKIESTEKSWM
ncbi:MAG: PH domain-containing protein [Bacteroidales bacterium]|nr:PH domain-containing protein [Bacteroidales bacterium]